MNTHDEAMTERTSPTTEQIKSELMREKYKSRYGKAMRGTVWTLLIVIAAAVICATFFFSILTIEGGSMEPTLTQGQYVLAIRTNSFQKGDIVAFYYNNKILLKRVIGTSGDWVDIDPDGNVSVNKTALDEPYVQDKSLGDGDVVFPYQVPNERLFVLGDHRSISSDSRSTVIGTVAKEQIVGKVVLKIWPLSKLEILK